jgi:hypothetical protein
VCIWGSAHSLNSHRTQWTTGSLNCHLLQTACGLQETKAPACLCGCQTATLLLVSTVFPELGFRLSRCAISLVTSQGRLCLLLSLVSQRPAAFLGQDSIIIFFFHLIDLYYVSLYTPSHPAVFYTKFSNGFMFDQSEGFRSTILTNETIK